MPRKPWRREFIPRPRSPLQDLHTDSPTSPRSSLSPPPSIRQYAQEAERETWLRDFGQFKKPTSPPKLPYPWVWRCHLCSSIYRLGVTRRCLEDGHYFCSIPSPPPSPPPKAENENENVYFGDGLGSGNGEGGEVEKLKRESKAKKEKRKKKKRKGRSCDSKFDYTGWEVYNEFRREVLFHRQHQSRCPNISILTEDRRGRTDYERRGTLPLVSLDSFHFGLGMFDEGWGDAGSGARRRDCWIDCDFPSECLNERKVEEAREREWAVYIENQRHSPDREGTGSEAFATTRNEMGLVHDSDSDSSSSSATSSSSSSGLPSSAAESSHHTSSLHVENISPLTHNPWSQNEEEELTFHIEIEPEPELEGVHAMAPLGTDTDLLGEPALEQNCLRGIERKNSVADEEPSSPASPLKGCFGFEDVDLGGKGRV